MSYVTCRVCKDVFHVRDRVLSIARLDICYQCFRDEAFTDCCGGSDENPPEHTLDCDDFPPKEDGTAQKWDAKRVVKP